MPRHYMMNWDGDPNFRWRKTYKGQKYVVTCQELGAQSWTQEGSGKLADQWWKEKVAELEGGSQTARILQPFEQVPLEKLKEFQERGEAAKVLLTELPFVKVEVEAEELARIVGPVQPERRAEALGEVVSKVTGPKPADPDRRLKTRAEAFLGLLNDQKPLTFREIRDFIRSLYTAKAKGGGLLLGAEMDIAGLDEAKVDEVFLWLKEADLTNATRKKRWGFFKRLVRHCWERRLIELPRNLDGLSFKVQAKKIKTYTPDEVRDCLAAMTPRLKLYALLGLNCGMTAADIGQLRKDQVDLSKGKLTRKRVKTADNDNVPEVQYQIWPETLQLLRDCWSDHTTLALTSTDGTSLWDARQSEDGSTPQKDLIYQYFKRAKIPITHKCFRSISATIIESHESYGRYTSHFLGHSPKSVKDRHYAAPSAELFDTILGWLRGRLLAK